MKICLHCYHSASLICLPLRPFGKWSVGRAVNFVDTRSLGVHTVRLLDRVAG